MKRLFWFLMILPSCGGPAAPTAPPTPPPIVYPTMSGGWGGTWAQVWLTGLGPGSQTCNETWVITGQTNGAFSGSFQSAGEGCASAGTINGNVLPSGELQVIYHVGGTGGCVLLTSDASYYGFVSSAGGLTAQAKYSLRCPYGNGSLDYNVSATVSMNRR